VQYSTKVASWYVVFTRVYDAVDVVVVGGVTPLPSSPSEDAVKML